MFTRHRMAILLGCIVWLALLGLGGVAAQTEVSRDSTAVQDSLATQRPKVMREKILYESQGRKDPFQPLFDKEKEKEEPLPLLQLEEATLVGIMRGPGGGLVLVRDKEQRTYVLREGSMIKNGYLRQVNKDGAIFNVAKFGRYRTVELELKSEKIAQSFEQGLAKLTPKPKTVIRPAAPPPAQPQGLRPTPSADGHFTLQIAAFRQEQDAQRLQRWLRERGYETRIEAVTIPESGHWYRVRYGQYESYDEVKTMAETLRTRFDFYCWIVPLDS